MCVYPGVACCFSLNGILVFAFWQKAFNVMSCEEIICSCGVCVGRRLSGIFDSNFLINMKRESTFVTLDVVVCIMNTQVHEVSMNG